MSKRYTSGVVSSTSPTVNAAGASGVFTLNQQSAAQSTNNWPPYKVEKSLRIRSSATAYLNRTPSSAGNSRIFTMSCWVKIGSPSYGSDAQITFLNAGDGTQTNGTNDEIQLRSDGTAYQVGVLGKGGTGGTYAQFTPYLRDPAAWYHVVIAIDTTQATQANRCRAYVNGVEQTAYITNGFTLNYSFTYLNSTSAHLIGRNNEGSGPRHTDAYFAEYNFIDGQQLTPSSFGATDKDGNWSPIAYTGSYGTNGFYLNFKDVTSAATTGYDYSGNGNNWTLSGFNVSTANTSYDSMIDVPVDQSDGTANNRGNYCTLNPLANPGIGTLSDGNLQLVTSTNSRIITGTMALPSTGQYYFEITATDYITDGGTFFGIVNQAFLTGAPSNGTWLGISTYNASYQNGTTTDTNNLTGTNVTNDGDIWCFAIDVTNNKFWVGRSRSGTLVWADGVTPAVNGSGATTISLPSGDLYPMAYRGGSYNETYNFNFGQRPFTHAPPTGFKALNTYNLPEPTIKQPNKYFDALLWTGDGSTGRNITGYGFSPEFLWIKKRSGAEDHKLNDIVRGVDKQLMSNRTEPEYTNTDQVRAFLSNGFTTDGSGSTNGNGATYVGWAWNAGNANTTNTSGTITSIVRANQTAGCSIVTYTSPNSSSNQTVGHGLGIKPSMIIVKNRDSAFNWDIYHSSLGYNSSLIFTTAATRSGAFGAEPTSTVFTTTNTYTHNGTDRYVAYCFAQVAGYSAFGSYTGNASTDGPFVYTGFRPKLVLCKKSSGTGGWGMIDTSINPYNQATTYLQPNTSNATVGGTSGNGMDMLSNGFKIRSSDASFNETSGDTYIYMAFAETPFKYARSR